MKIHDLFPSRYVAADDLRGQEVSVVMREVAVEEVDDNECRPVVYFDGMKKGLVLNKTNATTIATLYGEETDAWRGRLITIYPTETQFRSKMVKCIRVRLDAPRNGQPTEGSEPQGPPRF